MMQLIPRWKVTVTLPSREIVIWISDGHIENVLRTVATLRFDDRLTEQPIQIVVGLAQE